jgi:hypothetical protein
MDTLYSGISVFVRPIRKQSGKTSYGLFRHYATGAFMEYDNLEEAVYIAKYIERYGGDFGSNVRKAAHTSWMNQLFRRIK